MISDDRLQRLIEAPGTAQAWEIRRLADAELRARDSIRVRPTNSPGLPKNAAPSDLPATSVATTRGGTSALPQAGSAADEGSPGSSDIIAGVPESTLAVEALPLVRIGPGGDFNQEIQP